MVTIFLTCRSGLLKAAVTQTCIKSPTDEQGALEFTAQTLGERALTAACETLSKSGNRVFCVGLAGGRKVILRVSPHRNTFAFTRAHVQILSRLSVPVPAVLASGATATGGAYVILSWLPGRDLLFELPGMSQGQMSALARHWVGISRRIAGLPRVQGFGWAPIGRGGPMERWTDVFGEAAKDERELPVDRSFLGESRARLRALRAGLEGYFGTVEARCFLDDHCLKNILVLDGGLSGVIDVDFVFYGDPLMAVGATLAEIVRYVGECGRFYGQELVRQWSPQGEERTAIRFYAALYATGFLSLIDASGAPGEADRLTSAIKKWLVAGEAELV